MRAALLALAACSAQPARPVAPPPPLAPVAHEVLPDVPFARLDHDQRAEFMKQKVVPALQPIFQRHDAAKYAEFGCPTCHGRNDRYEMPNPALPKAEHSEWMQQDVQPVMNELLAAPASFGCRGCHVVP